jgi:hypothetical protein
MSFTDMRKAADNCGEMCGRLEHILYFCITGGEQILYKSGSFGAALEKSPCIRNDGMRAEHPIVKREDGNYGSIPVFCYPRAGGKL